MPTRSNLSIYFPKDINLYQQCPERYFKERVQKLRFEQSFSPALVKGIAAHRFLQGVALEYQKAFDALNGYDGPSVPIDLAVRAAAALPREPYPSDLAWEYDVQSLIEDVKYGISYLDGDARVLASESTYYFPYHRPHGCPPFALAAKVDLVLLRHNETGLPYLDVVDFKTGQSLQPNLTQEVASRIVVKQNASRLADHFAYIQSTTIYLGARTVRSRIIEDDVCGRCWAEIKSVVAAIESGVDWSPNLTPLCAWCPYFSNGCSLTPEASEAESLGNWLDRAVG